MSFLLDLVSKVKIESILNTFATIQHDMIRIPIPFQGINQSITKLIQLQQLQQQQESNTITTTLEQESERGGIRPGDAIDLVGISGIGKSYLLHQFATHTLKYQTKAHIIYIDLDDRVMDAAVVEQDRFHLFKPINIQYFIQVSLEKWLIQHADIHVLWIMLDGTATTSTVEEEKLVDHLRKLQKKWSFVLMTTTTGTLKTIDKSISYKWNYRFMITTGPKELEQRMELVWPMHMDAFAL